MTAANRSEFEPGLGDPSVRRHALARGLYLHLAIFALAMLSLYLMNSSTRGPDGAWWVIHPLQPDEQHKRRSEHRWLGTYSELWRVQAEMISELGERHIERIFVGEDS